MRPPTVGLTQAYPSTVMPMLRAVPAIIRIAASTLAAFKSSFFASAISRRSFSVTEPTFSLLGSPEAFANFMGNIGEINEERAKMKVVIEIFERQTKVEVEFWQVEKL